MISFTNVTKQYGPQILFVEASFQVNPGEKVGPIAKLQAMWKALPPPEQAGAERARAGCVVMRDFVVELRSPSDSPSVLQRRLR